jgi:hypothetical protein
MSPAACGGSPPGRRSKARGAAELLCALSCGSGLAAAERTEHQTSTAFVGSGLDPSGAGGSGPGGGLLRSPRKGSAAARCWPRSSPARNWPPGPGGLWPNGVTARVCRPWHPPLASGSEFAQPPLGVRAGGRVVGPGLRRPASRTVTLPTHPGTASQPGTSSQPGTPSWSETLTTIGREGQMAARRTGDTGALGEQAVREEW